MKYPLNRVIVYSIEDPCLELEDLKHILLYSLIVSYGIRVDTTLYVYSINENLTYVFRGEELRHLHAQEKALEGFARAIFCSKKILPGVSIFSGKHFLENLLSTELNNLEHLVFISANKSDIKLNPCGPIRQAIILPNYKTQTNSVWKHTYLRMNNIVYLKTQSPVYMITIAHYLLDVLYGGWVRRKGKIEWQKRADKEY